jgi:antitoxin (DNA-binding transcriptional repressor) of toxin-antitoxin stability system
MAQDGRLRMVFFRPERFQLLHPAVRLRRLLVLSVSIGLSVFATLPAPGDTLQGGVSEAALEDWRRETLPLIRLGQRWSDRFLPASSHTWYRLNPGLAGTWRATTIEVFDLSGNKIQEQKSDKTQSFGAEVDSQGNFWDRLDVPSLINVEREDVINHLIEYPLSADNTSPDQARRVKEGYCISVAKDSGLVVAIIPQKYTVTARDFKKNSFLAVSRHLDQNAGRNGQNAADGQTPTIQHTLYRRVGDFRAKPELLGEFIEYLKFINRRDLIPQ